VKVEEIIGRNEGRRRETRHEVKREEGKEHTFITGFFPNGKLGNIRNIRQR
jgi:hypothetical protein